MSQQHLGRAAAAAAVAAVAAVPRPPAIPASISLAFLHPKLTLFLSSSGHGWNLCST